MLILLKRARWNSGLLTAFFALQAVQNAATGNWLFLIVTALATYSTLNDTFVFHNIIKEGEKDGLS